MADSYSIGDSVVGPTDQRYTVVAVEPYRNKRSGRESVVLVLRSTCRECGAEYTCKSGPTARGAAVHCPEHRLTRDQAARAMNTPEAIAKRVATRRRRATLARLL